MNSLSGGRVLIIVSIVVVVAAVTVGLTKIGSPAVQREKRLDAVRVTDLAAIENLISGYFRLHKALPPDLLALGKEPGYLVPRKDPESGMPYEYEVLSADSYRLCAFFRRPSSGEQQPNLYFPNNIWTHASGHQCFDRSAPSTRQLQ